MDNEVKLYRMSELAEMYSKIKDKEASDFWDGLLIHMRCGLRYKYGGSIAGEFNINDEFFCIRKRFDGSIDFVSVPKKLLKNFKKHYNANVYTNLKYLWEEE